MKRRTFILIQQSILKGCYENSNPSYVFIVGNSKWYNDDE